MIYWFLIRGISHEARVELEARFAEAAAQEAAWQQARTAPALPATLAPGRPVRRLPPRPAWWNGEDAAPAAHAAVASTLGPRSVRRP